MVLAAIFGGYGSWAVTKKSGNEGTVRMDTNAKNDPDGIRTRVTGVKGQCPRPLDDRAARFPSIPTSIPRSGRSNSLLKSCDAICTRESHKAHKAQRKIAPLPQTNNPLPVALRLAVAQKSRAKKSRKKVAQKSRAKKSRRGNRGAIVPNSTGVRLVTDDRILFAKRLR
jgi:hypothetical protein